MVNMPVVTAAGLKDHVTDIDPFRGEHIQVAGALKILRIGLIFLPFGKNAVTVKLFVHSISIFQFRAFKQPIWTGRTKCREGLIK